MRLLEIPRGPGRLDEGVEPASIEEDDALDSIRRNGSAYPDVEAAP